MYCFLSNTGKQQLFANQLSHKDRSVPNDIDLRLEVWTGLYVWLQTIR